MDIESIKNSVSDFITSHFKIIILVLVLILALIIGSFVLKQIKQEQLASAPVVTVNLIEGQSYEFEHTVKSCDLAEGFNEYLDINITDQKMYALANYADGTISFMCKLEDGSYEKYIVTITSIDTSPKHEVSIARGSTVTVRDWDAAYTAEWSSDDEQVATVDQEGNVTGIDLGECNITAKITDEIFITYKVTVVDVALSPANTYIYVGDTLTYKVLGYEPAANEKMFIASDNTDVISVKGMKARAVAEGESTISLELNGRTYTATLAVLGLPTVEDVIVTVDNEAELVVNNIPKFSDCEELKVVDENIASFNDGKILAKSLGTTQLTGKIKGHEFSCKITVTGAALVPDANAKYDTSFNKYNSYENLTKYSVKENETLRIYFTNANSNTPTVKTQDNNFRVFDTTNEYIEVIGTNPGVGLLVVDFDDNRLYAEIHVQHTNSTVTQRQWEVELKNFTDTLKQNGDWTYSDEVQPSYTDAKSDLTRKINGISFINYALQDLKVFEIENYLTIGEDGKITGNDETMQIVDKYVQRIDGESFKEKEEKESLDIGDIVIWKDGSVSVYVGMNNGGTMTWYEVNQKLVGSDGFFTKFYSEDNKDGLEIAEVLRLHYTL